MHINSLTHRFFWGVLVPVQQLLVTTTDQTYIFYNKYNSIKLSCYNIQFWWNSLVTLYRVFNYYIIVCMLCNIILSHIMQYSLVCQLLFINWIMSFRNDWVSITLKIPYILHWFKKKKTTKNLTSANVLNVNL